MRAVIWIGSHAGGVTRVPVAFAGRKRAGVLVLSNGCPLGDMMKTAGRRVIMEAIPVGADGREYPSEFYDVIEWADLLEGEYALTIKARAEGAPVPALQFSESAEVKRSRARVEALRRSERDAYKKDPRNCFGAYNSLWGQHYMGAARRVGRMMELIALARPADNAEWFEAYTRHPQGRTWAQIEAQAAEWQKITERADSVRTLSPSEALTHHLIHILDETYDGYKREQDVIKKLETLGVFPAGSLFHPGHTWDANYAIDAAVRDNTARGFSVGVQVKPSSFFRHGDLDHRLAVCDKMERAQHEHGVTVYTVDADEVLAGSPTLYTVAEVRDILTGRRTRKTIKNNNARKAQTMEAAR